MRSEVISIVGTGALGGYYGGLMAKAGHDVHFLLKSDYEHVKKWGLKVESPQGDFHLNHVKGASALEALPQSDLLILSSKTIWNSEIFPGLAARLKPEGKVLILQNGLGIEEDLEKYIPSEKIFGGICFLCSVKLGPGHIQHQDYGRVKLGQYKISGEGKVFSKDLQHLEALFEKSNIEVQCMDNLILERWKKLVWNIPFNGLAVLSGVATDTMMQDTKLRNRAEVLMQEVLRMAQACGFGIEASFIHNMLEATQKMIPYKPSMLLDYERGAALEIHTMYEVPLQKAREAGYLPREVENLYNELCSLTGGRKL